jgi:hypothetical protein
VEKLELGRGGQEERQAAVVMHAWQAVYCAAARDYVSKDIAVSPISTLACLAPGQETRTSLNALVDLSGAVH